MATLKARVEAQAKALGQLEAEALSHAAEADKFTAARATLGQREIALKVAKARISSTLHILH